AADGTVGAHARHGLGVLDPELLRAGQGRREIRADGGEPAERGAGGGGAAQPEEVTSRDLHRAPSKLLNARWDANDVPVRRVPTRRSHRRHGISVARCHGSDGAGGGRVMNVVSHRVFALGVMLGLAASLITGGASAAEVKHSGTISEIAA